MIPHKLHLTPIKEQETNIVFRKLSSVEDEESEVDEQEEGPPAAALHRRRALVPPKMITDGYESTSEDGDNEDESQNQLTTSDDSSVGKNRRRSSIVVIPPMHMCPGDLLVYSQVLTHRNDFLADLDGSTQCLAVAEDSSRKGKNSWSLLRLFDRSNRGKSESLCGLEEVLSRLPPSEFVDEQLAKYKGMQWSEFVCMFEEKQVQQRQEQRAKSIPSTSSVGTPLRSDLKPGFGESDKLLRTNSIRSESEFRSSRQMRSNLNPNQLRLSVGSSVSEHQLMKISSDTSPYRPLLEHQQSCDVTNNRNVKPIFSCEVTLNNNGVRPTHSLSFDEASSNDIFPLEKMRGTPTLTKGELKRREALWDLFQSEVMFLYDHLLVLKNVFMEPLKKIQVEGFAMFAQPEVLFGNLDELCCVTYAFCKEFLHLIFQHLHYSETETTDVLVRLFQKSTKATALRQAYHRYSLNYINALNYLETLRRQVEFNEFEKWCSRDLRCKKLQLTDLLVSPVQHIMRVPLLLKEIEMRTDQTYEKEAITSILELEENSIRELDDKMKWLKNFERLLEIQRNIIWPSITELDPKAFIPEFLKAPLSKQPCERLIVSPKRQIVLEGPLQLFDSGKTTEMYVILFDDMFLITRRKKGLHKKKSSITENWASSSGRGSTSQESGFKYVVYKQPLSLDRFFIHDVSPQDGAQNNLKHAFVLVLLNRFQQVVAVYTFQSSNETVKATWLSKLKDTIDKWKRTLQNTMFQSNQSETALLSKEKS
ncbi:rho guanine nucleotide exchange factor 11-like isoform X2 [Limulus polyphemus]|uniref:Rho guanine nucleotide exchange factor 11-like isoform X2 n=1 Tax=Limulus polyphemus TaxID=6850 RepID=A0ABM1BAH0_LIMPO|nr:rho guanine nucleotide exchange factor 11-like isoform X2 [Limulus polyphemus]